MDLQVRIGVIFVAEKRLQRSFGDCCSFFVMAVGVQIPLLRDCPGGHTSQAN